VAGGTPLVVALFIVAIVSAMVAVMRRPRVPRLPDALVSAVLDVLPGGNCGACGNDSCFDAACRIASGELSSAACVTGGTETAKVVSAALRAGQAR
jgi:Na+-translocating ferredoxin:NAD+ oxidoreductase RNF subunit RnfB